MKFNDALDNIFIQIKNGDQVKSPVSVQKFIPRALEILYLTLDCEISDADDLSKAKKILTCLEHYKVPIPEYIDAFRVPASNEHVLLETFTGSLICSCKSDKCNFVSS